MASADTLIDRLLLRETGPCLLLATLAAGYATRVSTSTIQKLFVRTGHYYHVSRQVPTYLVAQQLRYLGPNGVAALSVFLEEDFADRIDPSAGLFDFVNDDQSRTGRARFASVGMLRRLAIDTVGAMRLPESAELMLRAFGEYSELGDRYRSVPELANEWQHNCWHVCYALHSNASEQTARFLRARLESGECDILTEAEILYHLSRFDDGGRHQEYWLGRIQDRLSDIGGAMKDNFNWRRAHACEAVGRISSLSPAAHQLVSRALEETVAKRARTDPDYMVRHYASLALGQIGNESRIEQLVDTAVDTTVEPWARFASARGLSALLDRTHTRLADAAVLKINGCLNASIANIGRDSRRVRLDDIVLGSLLAVLADHGTKDSLPVLDRYTEIDVDVIALGNLSTLARVALSRCVQRVDLELSEVTGGAVA